ncbi:MAG: ABC transporter ATP-binding protein [Candidatus Omnitrophica bacterium]|nr:ABC transporter ATP-binding protein [Candidatus Omnitrophota bacterium]
MEKLLEIKNLRTCFYQDDIEIKAVDDVSLFIEKNSILGVVGESGCGKTMTALSIARLLPGLGCQIVSGSIKFSGIELLELSAEELRKIRGKEISYVFQEPSTSLNPVLSIKEQIEEVVLLHRKDIKSDIIDNFIIKQLEAVGINNSPEKVFAYPHQLSGGEKQRVMIAMAIISNPLLLIADEPTTALDVTIQAQILELILELKEKLGLSVMFISHDLNVVGQLADYICVMYAGQVVEFSQAEDLLKNPKHPYTKGLFDCLPAFKDKSHERLSEIPGEVPKSGDFPKGCRFHPRCLKKIDRCEKEMPPLFFKNKNQEVRCWLYLNL